MTSAGGSDVVGHFRAGLEVLRRYPVIALPPLAAQGVVFFLGALFLGSAAAMWFVGGSAAGLAGALGAAFLIAVVGGFLSLLSIAVVTVMAREGLAGREPSIGDAVNAVVARLADVLVASVLTLAIVWVGMILFVIPGLLAAVFLLFTLPGVLLDGDSAVAGIKRSVKLVRDNLGPVVGLIIGVIFALVVVVVVSAVLGVVPVLGHLAQAVLMGAFAAYFTVVVVRVYQALPRG